MALSDSQQISMWEEVLRLCNVNDTETVVVLTKPEARPENIKSAYNACIEIGATTIHMEPHIGPARLRDNGVAMEAMRQADMVIDLVGLHLFARRRASARPRSRHPHPLCYRAADRTGANDAARGRQASRQRGRQANRSRKKPCASNLPQVRPSNAISANTPSLYEYGYSDDPGPLGTIGRPGSSPPGPTKPPRGARSLSIAAISFSRSRRMCRRRSGSTSKNGYITEISGDFDASYMREFYRGLQRPRWFRDVACRLGPATTSQLDGAGHDGQGADQRQ